MTAALSRAQVELFRTFVGDRLGLQVDDERLVDLAELARERMAAAGAAHFETYLARLGTSPRGSAELRALAERLTINETFFFRNADSFRACAETALPERIAARSKEKRLRILSAGCASGEEPYSLAMLVRDALPDLASWSVTITGLDVNATVLAKAAEARYSTWSLRATPDDARRRFFRPQGRDFVLVPEVRQMVTFEERNLVDDDPLYWRSLGCDLIFCRNVLMYFTPSHARAVVGNLRQALLPDGFLFLGHAEALRGLTHEFQLCHTHDTFYYRRSDSTQALQPLELPGQPVEGRTDGARAAVVDLTPSWVGDIRRASQRIAALTIPLLPVTPEVAPRPWSLGLVLAAVREERFIEALELLGALPPDAHRAPDVLLLRGVVLTNIARLDEAEVVCTRLVQLDPANAGAHYLLALCREHVNDTAGAIAHDAVAVRLDAAFAMPHLHLGIMARRAGDAAGAQRELALASVLLAREASSRLLLFGGGFSRDALLQLCRTELRASTGVP